MYKKIKYPYTKHSLSNSDINSVTHALKSNFITGGDYVSKFEKKLSDYVSSKYCSLVSSGTSALHLSLLAIGIRKGDKVIVPSITFVATANAVKMCEGEVIFCDVNPLTGLIDINHLSELIKKEKNIKCVMPVHLNGKSCDMKRIKSICLKNKIFIIDDCCHALGGTYDSKKIGSGIYSDISTFSFHPAKIITTGEGGAITTNNKQFYEKINLLRSHGIQKNFQNFINLKNGFENNIPNLWYYEQQELGYNYRISDFQCALGINQLKIIDKKTLKKNKLASYYDELLENNKWISSSNFKNTHSSIHARHLYNVKLKKNYYKKRNSLMTFLLKFGIQTQVHYIPLYKHPFYKSLSKNILLKGAEKYYRSTLSLPMYETLNKQDIKFIVSKILHFFKE